VADLHIEGITILRSGSPVLENATMTFLGGTRTVLWGVSGAGKSTLLAAIAGLVTPSAGSIEIGARVLFSKSAGVNVAPHARRIGLVFQDLALWPHLRAIDQVGLAGRLAGLDRAGAGKLLESVGLGGLARRRPGELSGGEQQRLAIARAIAPAPEILLLDEPFSSADMQTRLGLHSLLRTVSARIPGPTIYVTHDPVDAREFSENAVILEGKRLRTAAVGALFSR
jgi:iron(III) transport system ATP-binding protein